MSETHRGPSRGSTTTATKQRYQVLVSKEWLTVPRAYEQPNGWLSYELWDDDGFDGKSITQSVAQPGKWRYKPATTRGK